MRFRMLGSCELVLSVGNALVLCLHLDVLIHSCCSILSIMLSYTIAQVVL